MIRIPQFSTLIIIDPPPPLSLGEEPQQVAFACVTDHFLIFLKGGPTMTKVNLTASEVPESASKGLNNYGKKQNRI